MSDSKAFGGRFRLGGLDADAVARAEAALKSLSSNFDAWMAEELDKLDAARARLRAEGLTPQVGEALYFRAHDLKGLGSTYGYPLVTRLAGSLCRVLHDPAQRLSAPAYLIEAHIDAIHAVVRKNLRDEADDTGRALSEELETQVSRLVQAAA